MLVDREQEGFSLLHHFLILHRDHLVEVNCLSLIFRLRLLVVEPDGTRSKRFQVIPGTQLIVEYFQLVLNLGIVTAWSRVDSHLLGNLFHEVSHHR